MENLKFLALAEKRIRKAPRMRAKGFLESYVGNNSSNLEFLGLSVPQVREIARELQDSIPDIKGIRETYLASNIYELRSLLLIHLDKIKARMSTARLFTGIKPLAMSIDNWAHSDSLSDLYSYCLEGETEVVLPTLRKWNKSKREWLIRQSLVSLLYYSSKRKKLLPFSLYISFVQPHLASDLKYVQKGVGWTLREIRNVYEKETDLFLQENITSLKSYAFSAATEKMSLSKKAMLLRLRKR